MAEKWEYKVAPVPPDWDAAKVEEGLNGLGLDGWELAVNYVTSAAYNAFVFKRPKK